MGPIVINLSRVMVDLLTFSFIIIILFLAFVPALVSLKATNSRCPDVDLVDPGEQQETFVATEAGDGCWYNWTSDVRCDFVMVTVGVQQPF